MQIQNNMLSPLNALSSKDDDSKGAALIGFRGVSLDTVFGATVKQFSLLDDALSSVFLRTGDVLAIGDRSGELFDVVSGTAGANGYTLIAHNILPVSLKLRLYEGIGTKALGCDMNPVNGTGGLSAALGLVKSISVDNSIKVSGLDIGANRMTWLNGGGEVFADTVEGDSAGNGLSGYHVTKNIAFSTAQNLSLIHI